MRVAIVGLGLIGGSIGLAAAGARGRGRRVRPRSRRLPRRASSAGRRPGSRRRSRARLPTSDVAVVCGPVVHLPALVEQVDRGDGPSGARSRMSGRRSRRPGRGGRVDAAVRGRPPGVRLGGSRGRERARRPLPGRDLVSHARRGHRPRPPPHACTASSPASAHGPSRSTRAPTTAWWRSRATCRTRSRTSSQTRPARAGVDGHDPLGAVGGSFRDMTRVAGANPRIWVDIFLDNREALLDGLREHGRRVEELARALEREDAGFLARWIGEAAGNRRRLLEAAYEAVPEELYRVRVRVLDRPGVLSGITQALGAEGINIEDFELHHMSADAGGTAVDRRRRARARPAARSTCSTPRATARSRRRRSRHERRRPPHRAGGRAHGRARGAGRQVGQPPGGAGRGDLVGVGARPRLRRLGRHALDGRGRRALGVEVERHRRDRPASCTASACAGFAPRRSRSTSATPGR